MTWAIALVLLGVLVSMIILLKLETETLIRVTWPVWLNLVYIIMECVKMGF